MDGRVGGARGSSSGGKMGIKPAQRLGAQKEKVGDRRGEHLQRRVRERHAATCLGVGAGASERDSLPVPVPRSRLPGVFPSPQIPSVPQIFPRRPCEILVRARSFPRHQPPKPRSSPLLPLPCPRPATALLLSHTFSALPSTQPPHSKQTGEMWSTAREIAAGDVVIAWMVIPAFTTCLHTLTLALSP